jgi:methionyl-tRNA synthetase
MEQVNEIYPSNPEENVADEVSSDNKSDTVNSEGKIDSENVDLIHKPMITIDDFSKIELRSGKVISCEAVPKSKKLLCFKIKSGNETRQILSGIHKFYEPEQLVGKTIVYVANLEPRKLAGLESQGMILSAEGPNGELSVVSTEREVPSSSELC